MVEVARVSQGPVPPPGASSELPGGLGQLGALVGTTRRHHMRMRRHFRAIGAAARGWSPSCLPPWLSGDQGTADLPQDSPCLLGLQSFIMEMGMTTEHQDQARGAAGPARVCVNMCESASTGRRLG